MSRKGCISESANGGLWDCGCDDCVELQLDATDDMCVECRVFDASRSQDYPTLCPSCAADEHSFRFAP